MAFFGRSAPPPLSRLEELKRLLDKEPGSRQFLALAEELRKEGEFAEAVRALENGLRYHPGYVAAHVSLGRLLRECGRPDDALKSFLNALKIDSENLVAIKQSAQIYEERGDQVEAVKKLKRYRGLNPGDKEVSEQIERLDLELGTTSRLRPSTHLGAAPGAPNGGEARTKPGWAPPARPESVLPIPGPARVPPPLAQAATEPLPRIAPPLPSPPPPLPAPVRNPEVLELSYDAAPAGADAGGVKGGLAPAPEVFLFDVEEQPSEPVPSARETAWESVASGADAAGEATIAVPSLAAPVPAVPTVPSVPSAPPAQPPLAPEIPPPPAAESRSEPRREMVTETLADLYLAQGLRAEARNAFDALARAENDPDRAAAFRNRARAVAAEEAELRAADPRRQRLEEYLSRIAPGDRRPDGLDAIVEELVGAGIGITTAVVAETGGVPVVIAGRFGSSDEFLAAELAAFWKNLKRGSDEYDAGEPGLVALAADSGGALVSGIGDGYALVLRIDEGAPLGRIRYRAVEAASRLRPLLA